MCDVTPTNITNELSGIDGVQNACINILFIINGINSYTFNL